MKKKILALTSAVVLTLMSSMTAFAAGSPSSSSSSNNSSTETQQPANTDPAVGSVEAPAAGQTAVTILAESATADVYAATTVASDGYIVTEASAQTVASAEVAAQNLVLNNLAVTGAGTGNIALMSLATDPAALVSATILSTVEVKPLPGTQKVDGMYIVGLANAAIAAGDTIVILHFNGTAWEAIYPISVSDGLVVFAVSSLSPISIVKVSANTAVAQAPKTGRTLPVAAMAFTAFAAGALYCGKKYFA
jgi:hypothetical protein